MTVLTLANLSLRFKGVSYVSVFYKYHVMLGKRLTHQDFHECFVVVVVINS
jgi:hypothetical protein